MGFMLAAGMELIMITSKKSTISTSLIINAVFILICALCVIPLITVVSVSLSNENYILAHGYSILPHTFDLTAYKYLLKYPQGILKAYGVSIFVTFTGTILNLLVCSMFAYAVSRKDYKFRYLFTFIVIFTMLFNGGIVSNYIVVTNYYHLQDNLLALILPYAVIPLYVLVLRTFFATVPVAIIESAKIDGASEFRIFFRMIAPLSKPAIATVGVLVMLLYWNDWWLGLLYIDDNNLFPIQLMLNYIMQNIDFLRTATMAASGAIKASDFPSDSARMALCVLAAGPMLFVFPFFQKYFVKGLTIGSVK